ncbi:Pyruvate decarboxylase [Colletotrichum viniferum]|nr:Pyruvate decarboxylase [Colletotrichum viniferum]
MPLPQRVPLARYLFTRLSQQNVKSLFGVPGDFTLRAQDHVKPAGLKWIGNCNELNAGYAADGYARTQGLGALMTTYGVGELSALNAIAGSYAEHVPVVHIVGTPATRLQKRMSHMAEREQRYLHHTLAHPAKLNVFSEIAAKVTAAQAKLDDANTAPEMVDWVLGEAKRHSRPVYIELPSDLVGVEVDGARLGDDLRVPEVGTRHAAKEQANILLNRLMSAKQPLLLVDRGMGMQEFRAEINNFIREFGIPTLSLPSGAGMVDNDISNYYGVHSGPVGAVDTLPYLATADVVLALGPMFSDTQTLGWQVLPEPAKTIVLGKDNIDGVTVDTRAVLTNLCGSLRQEGLRISGAENGKVPPLGDWRKVSKPLEEREDSPITQTGLYQRLNRYLQPYDTLILGNATPIIGGRDMVLPRGARAVSSGMWFSIGHMLPAALGISLGYRDRAKQGQTILIDGDGNIQMTVQEISTIVRERLDITIFVIQNQGYAYERLIHGLDEPYNDLAPWRYLDAPRFFGAPEDYPVQCHRIETWSELDKLLDTESFRVSKGLKLVELVLGKYDVPEKFRQVFKSAGENLG